MPAAQALPLVGKIGPEMSTLQQLLNLYLAKRTPLKGESKQDHDQRAASLSLACLGPGRRPETLNRIDWENFIEARRRGGIPGHPPVGERQIAYDLKFMIAVLNWATGAGVNGQPYLAASPWSAERRRALGLKMPRPMPKPQPTMTTELHERLIEHAPDWRFRLAMILGRGTISRNGSVRLLKWADIDFERRTIRWRGEYQKDTHSRSEDRCTPLSAEMVRAIRAADVQGIGEAWIFPSPRDPTKPCSRHVMQGWLQTAKRRLLNAIEDPDEREAMRAALAALAGVGFHAQKRYAVRAHRHLPAKVLEALARTKYSTLLEVYDHLDVEEMRRYVEANGDLQTEKPPTSRLSAAHQRHPIPTPVRDSKTDCVICPDPTFPMS
jgi:integrase